LNTNLNLKNNASFSKEKDKLAIPHKSARLQTKYKNEEKEKSPKNNQNQANTNKTSIIQNQNNEYERKNSIKSNINDKPEIASKNESNENYQQKKNNQTKIIKENIIQKDKEKKLYLDLDKLDKDYLNGQNVSNLSMSVRNKNIVNEQLV